MKYGLFVFVLACSAPAVEYDVAEVTPSSGSESPAVEEVAFVVAPFTLLLDQGTARVDADGRLTMDGVPEVQVEFRPNGDIMSEGERIASVSADGTYRNSAGTIVTQISEDGSMTFQDHAFSFGPDGVLRGPGDLGRDGGPGATLSPADSPAKRVAMSVIILLMM